MGKNITVFFIGLLDRRSLSLSAVGTCYVLFRFFTFFYLFCVPYFIIHSFRNSLCNSVNTFKM